MAQQDREGVNVTGGQAIVANNRVEKPKSANAGDSNAHEQQRGKHLED